MRRRTLFLALIALLGGCASAPEPGPDRSSDGAAAAEDRAESSDDTATEDGLCVRAAAVTVHVWNQGSAAVRLSFGPYAPARITEAFSRSTYAIPRPYLRSPVMIEIARGGLQVGPTPVIQTEAVVCNTATLVIGGQPRYSVFYGDAIYSPRDLRAADSLKAEADSATNGEG